MDIVCIACDKPATPADMSKHGYIHFDCVRARARAAQLGGRCICRDKKRPGGWQAPHGQRGRRWIPCLRCLGVIRQVG